MDGAGDAPRDPRARRHAITKVVTVTVAPQHEDELVGYAEQLVAQVHANEPATLLYVVTRDPSRPHTYVWVERPTIMRRGHQEPGRNGIALCDQVLDRHMKVGERPRDLVEVLQILLEMRRIQESRIRRTVHGIPGSDELTHDRLGLPDRHPTSSR